MVIQATRAPSTLTWDLVVNHQSLWNVTLLTGLGASGMVALITALTIGVTCLTRSKIVAMGFSFVLIFTGPTFYAVIFTMLSYLFFSRGQRSK